MLSSTAQYLPVISEQLCLDSSAGGVRNAFLKTLKAERIQLFFVFRKAINCELRAPKE